MVFLFHSETILDVVVDVQHRFRSLYFGKGFVNYKAIKRLTSNLSAKYSKKYRREHIIKVYNVE